MTRSSIAWSGTEEEPTVLRRTYRAPYVHPAAETV